MTVSPLQIIQAQAQGLVNVIGLAAACDRHKFPFYLACTICDKETDGRNIYGHDVGGIFTGPSNINIEVTEANYQEFLRRLAAGERSNGVGVFQLTWKGYHIGPDSVTARGLKAWVPADNIFYGVSILSASLKRGLDEGLTLEKAFWNTAKAYNGNDSYADDAVVKARTWAATVGSSDMEDAMAERIPFRGLGLTCSCVVESLPWVEYAMIRRGIIKQSIDIKQLGYRDDVGASAGTHARGGCVDVAQRSPAAIQCWREWGWTMQDRSAWFPTMPHAHGWPYGCPHLSDAARDQRTDWDNRRNGLASNGPVAGMWPVTTWDAAIERMVPTLFTAKDIANEIVEELIREAPRIAKAFLTADDIITAGHTEPNPANTAWAAKTFITNDFNALDDIRDQAKAIRAVLEKLAAPPTP